MAADLTRYFLMFACVASGLIASTARAQVIRDEDIAKDVLDRGYSFVGNVTQFGMGVVDGGNDDEPDVFRYSGHGDYLLNADLHQFGCQEGFFLRMRVEHRFGDSLNPVNTGSALPPALAGNLPVDNDHVYITNLVLTQALSENFAVFGGKLNSLDADQNDFASGRGITQFLGAGFALNPAAILASPYSSLGVGVAYFEDAVPVAYFSVSNPIDTTRTFDLDDVYEEGVVLTAGIRKETGFFGKKGHHSFTGIWNSRTFTELEPDPRGSARDNETFALTRPRDGVYALLYNFDQYLVEDSQGRGFGLFGRYGNSDPKVNPVENYFSLGIGGNNMIMSSRRDDTFGVGWYYADSSDDANLQDLITTVDFEDGQGVETYYNIAMGTCAFLTFDYQYVKSVAGDLDPAHIAGFRLNLAL
ncbi:carbohydrate porin [Aporhodopirellula aestuarii]|uniref:Carbohydrate porin n=1 Tax=Aporhodopirellula aestuarii TaxID=2950107 RepID=A0ABT0U753_9BACT|nr:carbohydrate porin [Aporhodopirellula aestuarii]MCM2372621.1 carbohydrate porin [Aporhodopirellula aestuarii]